MTEERDDHRAGVGRAASTWRLRFPCSSLPAPSSAPPTGWPASDICCGGTSWPICRRRGFQTCTSCVSAAHRPSCIPRRPSAPRRPTWRVWRRSACRCRPPSCCRSSCAPTSSSNDAQAERHLRDGLKEGIEFLENATGRALRRPPQSAPGIGALRRGPIDAGHAGHGAQCRLHAGRRAGPDPDDRPSAARVGLPAALSRKLRRDRARRSTPAPFAARLAELTASEGVVSDRELDSEALERLAADEQALVEERRRWLARGCRRLQLDSRGARGLSVPG